MSKISYNVFIRRFWWFNNWFWLRFAKKYLFTGKEIFFSKELRLPNLLKEIGFFKSTSEARQANFIGEVPEGWSEYRTNSGKYLSLFNPSKGYWD